MLRPHSTPATLQWLQENYEAGAGVCIPRNTLYQHYVDFCSMKALQPVNAASFGKVGNKKLCYLYSKLLLSLRCTKEPDPVLGKFLHNPKIKTSKNEYNLKYSLPLCLF